MTRASDEGAARDLTPGTSGDAAGPGDCERGDSDSVVDIADDAVRVATLVASSRASAPRNFVRDGRARAVDRADPRGRAEARNSATRLVVRRPRAGARGRSEPHGALLRRACFDGSFAIDSSKMGPL